MAEGVSRLQPTGNEGFCYGVIFHLLSFLVVYFDDKYIVFRQNIQDLRNMFGRLGQI
jgi:hypothetical protein